MKRSLAAFLVLCFTSYYLNGQAVLSGKITDKVTGEPIPGAALFLPDLKAGTVAGLDGLYHLSDIPKIKTLLQIKMLGYATVIKVVDLNEVTTLNIEMDEAVIEADEIVITGTSHATEISKNPAPMTTIDQKYLSESAASNIIDAMVKVPGLSAISTGPNVSKPIIRGLGYNRVLTLFDGLRQDGQQWGDEHGIETDQFLVDRIEVIKGPASLTYGSDALGGVINMLPASPAPEGTLTGNALVSYQSNNRQCVGSFSVAQNKKGFVWGMRGTNKFATNYTNNIDGRVFGTKFNEKDFSGYIGLNHSKGFSHLSFTLYDNTQEIPDGSRDSLTRKFTRQNFESDSVRVIATQAELNSYAIGTIHQRVQHYRLYSDNSLFIHKNKLSVKLGVQQSKRREFGHPEYPALASLFLTLSTTTYDVKYYLPERNGWQLTFGANGMYQQNKNKGATEFVIPAYYSLDAGAFAYLKKSLKKLSFAAGIRYDVRSFTNNALYTKKNLTTGFDEEVDYAPSDSMQVKQFDSYHHIFHGFSASLGTTVSLNKHVTLKGNLARGYRAPNISEISARGVHPGTGIMQLGNSNFKPEFSLQEDFGLFVNAKHASASIELFNNTISNYIYNEKLSSASGDSVIVQDNTAYPVYKFRQTTAQICGGEFSFDLHPHPLDWLHFENTAAVLFAENKGGNGSRITDSTKYLPFIPPFHTNSELRADFKKKRGCFSNLYIKLSMQHYAAQNRAFLAYGTETKTPSYTLFEIGTGSTILSKKNVQLFTIHVLCTNLFDAAWQSNMNRLKYMDNYPVNGSGRSGIYGMGRNVSVKVIIPFNYIKQGKSDR